MNQEKLRKSFFDMLEKVYPKSPGLVMTLLSGNSTYVKAGDDITLNHFPKLKPLYTGRLEWRVDNWWRERIDIVSKLLAYGLITQKQSNRFLSEYLKPNTAWGDNLPF